MIFELNRIRSLYEIRNEPATESFLRFQFESGKTAIMVELEIWREKGNDDEKPPLVKSWIKSVWNISIFVDKVHINRNEEKRHINYDDNVVLIRTMFCSKKGLSEKNGLKRNESFRTTRITEPGWGNWIKSKRHYDSQYRYLQNENSFIVNSMSWKIVGMRRNIWK